MTGGFTASPFNDIYGVVKVLAANGLAKLGSFMRKKMVGVVLGDLNDTTRSTMRYGMIFGYGVQVNCVQMCMKHFKIWNNIHSTPFTE